MDAVQDPAAGSLSRSRIVPPQVPAEYSLRPAIRNLLDRNPHSRVLMFSAPAGFGKTCALAALARERTVADQAVAWLSLAEEDDDPARFCRQLIEALGEAVPQLGDDAQTYLQNTMRVPVVAVIESLLGDLDRYARPLLLVLDDLHLVSNPDIFTGLNRLVQYAPPGLVLALGTRSQPALSLATWRAKGLLLEIGLEELRLGFEETREYLERSGLYLDEPCLKALYSQTEGWVVGVHLVSLWLRQQPQVQEMALLDGDKQAVSAYLLAAVFERLPGDLQEALLALGVASQLSGDLANALTGRQDGQALLERLESMQLFLLPLDRERQWYRFHLLFADFLRNRLRDSDPDRFKQLHFNASLWFTNHHMPTFAIEHACAAEDPEMIAALVDGCGLELINRGQLSLIYRWRKHVPDEIAERYPILVLTDVWSRASDLSLGEANRIIDELLARWGESRGDGPMGDQYLSALAVKAVVALQKDDLELCIALARRVEVQLGQNAAFLEVAVLITAALAQVVRGQGDQARRLLGLAQQRNHFLEGRYLDMQLANVEVILALEQGQVKQAQLLIERLRQRARPLFEKSRSALALPTITEALTAYYRIELDGLEERLGWALGHVDVINPIDFYAQGQICLARTQRLLGRPKEALASLAAMQALASRNQSWRFFAQAMAEEINLILQDSGPDRLKRAEQRLKSVDWNKMAAHYRNMAFNPVNWSLGVSRVRLLQGRGHFSEALHEITQLRGTLQPGWHGLQRLRLDILAALSYQRLGYQERANSLLGECLINAEREGVRSLFIEEGDGIRQLLQQLESTERQPALQTFIRGLLGIWPGQGVRKPQDALEEGLTEREREVVCLAAQGLSNEEIGQRLSLALGTVKWHLHNIYEKLKVRNRTQAIRRARELSLL
ncbi:helix-turn-helix transcriptional regulator [Pseudomonas aeruginosa]|uniref:LuxR C-terminal-related transcriptional regulator n=1 Tax=Pseudomonas TaxID=286 RepID=UPI0008A2CE9F|nr:MULTISPECIES: helix-turn-helix transcriptional regulator [Pseudomonas]EKV4466832.1 helix-turn-helix transcriptional regulator [Pseudomonas aeruginosa]ELD5770775.1 helix-turn-helix transcriptional regulator [Pseudomonas aeruginosa]ELP1288556.1 helix-turn-helix transcriptional regulator [Pseudomonas aeruginosa]ELQ7871194.1 helix-turn-helix transcriptional regulator [Pseudomonas aeruginosa]ELQ8102343.1 helix-turn-helix transcriptional regulator [Pseudomonas aeruginosa]